MRVNDRFQIEDEALAKDLWLGTGLAELINGIGGEEVEIEKQAGEESPNEHEVTESKNKLVMRERWGGEVVGLNPNIRIYRYGKGQFFDKHCEWLSSANTPKMAESVQSLFSFAKVQF